MLNTDLISTDNLQLTAFLEGRNQQSMDYFYDKYSPALYGIIFRITNNKHVAEECLMATFVKAWNERAPFQPSDRSLFTCLLNIARQAAFAAIEKQNCENPGTYNFVDGQNQHYSAFELVYIKGLSLVQAAELSGITVIELKTNIRKDLENKRDKTVKA